MKNTQQSFEDIKAQNPDCFVLIKDVVSDGDTITAGTLVYKHKKQEKVWQKATELRGSFGEGKTISIKYTGGKLDEIMAKSIFIL
jgi:hypothetical protein